MKKPPPKQEARSINVKKISSAGTGHVKAIRQGSEYGSDNSDDGLAEITIHHGAKTKPEKKGMDYNSPKRSTVHVSADQAKNLKIGQKVRVHLEHC